MVQCVAVVHGFTHPHAALVVDVHAGWIDKERLRGPQLEFQTVGDFERGFSLLRWKLGIGRGSKGGDESDREKKPAVLHGCRNLRSEHAKRQVCWKDRLSV